MPRKLDGFDPGSFGCHEAMHMASMLTALVDGELCDHEAVQRNAIWTAYAEQAREALHSLYQAIADEHLITDDQ